jgi:hypothetical protein
MASWLVSTPALRSRLPMLTAVWNGDMPWSDTTKVLTRGPAVSTSSSTALSAC